MFTKFQKVSIQGDINTKFFNALWFIWRSINLKKFQEEVWNHLTRVQQAMIYTNHISITFELNGQDRETTSVQVGWSEPGYEWININSDGSTHGNYELAGAGILLRNAQDKCVYVY